jgi:hypothetical protein
MVQRQILPYRYINILGVNHTLLHVVRKLATATWYTYQSVCCLY